VREQVHLSRGTSAIRSARSSRVPLFVARAASRAAERGVDHDAFGSSRTRCEPTFAVLRPHRELDQLLHGIGYHASMALDQRLRHPDDGFGLVAEETPCCGSPAQDLRVGAGVVWAAAILREQRRSTRLTRRVGGRADRMVATSSSSALVCCSAQFAVGIGLLETRQ